MDSKRPGIYNHKEIEQKWRTKWEEDGTYKTLDHTDKPKMYVLDMFPYPSGAGLHVGHPRGYIASDVFARFKRMQGFNVLHPMGFDSFGLPAEQYAIKTGNHPGPYTDELVAHYKKQLELMGFSYDWSRAVATHDPAYYKWTQWIFLQLYNSWYNTETNKTEPIETCIAKLSQTDPKWKTYSPKEQQDMLMQYRIAYEGYAEVNWCPELGTVLANDEVITAPDGSMVSERGEYPVIRKSMRQWFMRISSYAERLLDGLEQVDWPHGIKEIQRNWIGKSEGSEIYFNLDFKAHPEFNANRDIDGNPARIAVFTTRADTLFGTTYIVLAPEHPWVTLAIDDSHDVLLNKEEIKKYVAAVKDISEIDRINASKEKTGVEIKGVVAINPATGEEIPIWVADYVLASYGTGAVMAVPAHDERDWEFAKKYNLPIKDVIMPNRIDIKNPPIAGKTTKERQNVQAIIRDPKTDKYLCLYSREHHWRTFPMGGIEDGEDMIESITREIREETGYIHLELKRVLGGPVRAEYYAAHKGENRVAYTHAVMFDLIDDERVPLLAEEEGKHEFVWLSKSEIVYPFVVHAELNDWLARWDGPTVCTDDGVLYNSGEFNGLASDEARKKITIAVGGKLVTKYKMRDAIFARQRYWGEPIPLRRTSDGIIVPLSESELPLQLPDLTDFAPTGDGNSALSKSPEWIKEGYETNTMPGWAGSSWYFLRYMDPHNTHAFASRDAIEYWGQVDMYVGGAEHATGHLLYSRFWNMALHDLGYVPFTEPFAALRNQGMIAGTDGRKMSKRWGNVINPDDVVAQLGADTLRVYESFMGPIESHLPWSTDGIVGSKRFLERVYRVVDAKIAETTDPAVIKVLHKTIKKVTEDINDFSFNTAVSAMMIFLNELEKSSGITKDDFAVFLKLLAPFAPFITEELWNEMGMSRASMDGARHDAAASTVHLAPWPQYDESLIKDDEVTLAVQINGKVRAELVVTHDASKEVIETAALALPRVQEYLNGATVKKIIVVPGRVINIVI